MSLQAPVFIIIGPPHHGKTEARKILSELTYLKGGSTSELIYRFLALRRDVSLESLKALPKEELRPALIEAGDFMVGSVDKIAEKPVNAEIDSVLFRVPSALVRTLYMNGYNIIDGVRRKQELAEARSHLDWNGVRQLVIWVERPGTESIKDNTELTAADADVTVPNDGTLEDLRKKLEFVLEAHFGAQDKNPEPIPVIDLPPGQTIESKK